MILADEREQLAADLYALVVELAPLLRKQEEIEKALLDKMEDGDKIYIPGTAEYVVRRSRKVLKPEELEEQTPTRIWTKITKKVPVAALIDLAIKNGQLDAEVVASCYGRSKPWIEVR